MRQKIEFLNGMKAVIVMVVVHILFTGMSILYKLVTNDRMNLWILNTYRCLFATVFVLPLAFILERKTRPKLTCPVLFQAFLCGLFGISLSQVSYIESLALTSATVAAAIYNLVPAATLLLSVLFRLETLELNTTIGRSKVLGILTGIGGTMVLTFYKGAEINIWPSLHLFKYSSQPQTTSHRGNWIIGSFLAFISCSADALYLIFQAKLSEIYPYPYSCTAIVSIMGLIQSLILSLCIDRNWVHWKLGWNVGLLTAAYLGIVTSGLVGVMITWCIQVRGPVFVSNFNPLSLLLVAIVCSLVLEEKLHLGSIVGAVLIVGGLYMVLWGQSKEMKETIKYALTPSDSPENQLVDIVINGDEVAEEDNLFM